MNNRYIVSLSDGERMELQESPGDGEARARRATQMQIRLTAEQNHPDAANAAMVATRTSKAYRTKPRFIK